MITVYLDESEHSTASKYMAVAGFYGDDKQWTAFSSDWKGALGSRKALHMNALRISSKPERAKRLIDALGPLPYKQGLKSICSAVKFADYADLIQDGSDGHAKRALAGYPTCLGSVLLALNQLVPGNESIKIVCEDQKQYAEAAIRTFRAMRMGMSHPAKPYFSGMEFIPKNSSILTEPADCLAYAVTHSLENPKSIVSSICRPILGDGSVGGYKLSRDVIREMVLKTKSLLSGYKPNRISWLELSSNSDWESNASNTCKMGTFSRLVMLKICRIW